MKNRILIGLDNKCNIVINHPLFYNKSYLLDTFNHGSSRKVKTLGWLKYFFSSRDLTDKNLLIRMVTPGCLPYGILLASLISMMFLRYDILLRDNHPVQNWTAIALPTDGTYGFCRQDRTHPEGVLFLFSASEVGAYDLVFTGGSGQGEAVLTLFFNGHELPTTIPLATGWGNEISLRLPIQLTIIGSNRVELKIKRDSKDPIHWGVRNIRVIRKEESKLNTGNLAAVMEKIRSALQQKYIDGPEISKLYHAIIEIQREESVNELNNEITTLKREIERRMETLLRDTLVRLKTVRIIKDERTSAQILRDTRMWVPESWTKGLEILNEFDF